MAIYLFLRHDDIYDLEFASYIPHLSTVRSDGSVDNLVFKVHGKSDIEYKYLVLWACHDKPELCPVRHLLVYIHLCNIAEGYLFPNLDDSDNRKTYDSFLNYLKRKISPVLTRDMPITTHSFRKTGYLFACWGGGEFAVIMDSARHKTHAVAMNYYRDAKTTLHLMMLSGDSNEDNIIPDWKAVIVHQPENVRILIDGIVTLPLQDVARGYARYVKIEEEPLKSRSIHQILELTYRKNSTAMSKEAIKASLHSELSNLAPERLLLYLTTCCHSFQTMICSLICSQNKMKNDTMATLINGTQDCRCLGVSRIAQVRESRWKGRKGNVNVQGKGQDRRKI
jgi:hypothetical protein